MIVIVIVDFERWPLVEKPFDYDGEHLRWKAKERFPRVTYPFQLRGSVLENNDLIFDLQVEVEVLLLPDDRGRVQIN